MILLINMRIKIPSRTKDKYTGIYKKNKISGARGETRTRIGISPLDPKSSASTISATLAQGGLNNLIRVKVEVKKSSVNTVKKGTDNICAAPVFLLQNRCLIRYRTRD